MRFPQRSSFTIFPFAVRMLVADFFSGLAAFTILRIIFRVVNHSAAAGTPANWMLLSMVRGIQFDCVACGMILALPWLIMLCGMSWKKHESKFRTIAFSLTTVLFTIAFFAAFADMPLFIQSGKRLSIAALHWSSSPGFVLKIVFGNRTHIFLLLFFIAFSILFHRFRKRTATRIASSSPVYFSTRKNIALVILCSGVLMLSIRGRVSWKSPIRWGTAYFCTNAFANQTVLNPFYTFITSAYESSTHLPHEYHVMSDARATAIYSENSGKSALPESNISDSTVAGRNVVLVIMESMAAWKTGLYADGLKLTGCLDSLAGNGIFFSDFYSDGIHTFNGLYATLTGSQCLPKIHPLGEMNINSNPVSIAELLKIKGYSTVFFTTHDMEFDNMNGFMRGNGFDEMISERDYDYSTGINPMGVPDHILFAAAEKKVTQLSKNGKPFFATLLTGSDHEPFYVPGNIAFVPHGKNAEQKAANYADWSIGKFMKSCEKESWYTNTVFVFVADHGALCPGDTRDMYLAFHHIPCIILGPGISPQVNHSLGTQADILPTLMRIVAPGNAGTFMGIDLLHQERKRLFFTYDEEICSLDSGSFYIDRAVDPHLFLRSNNDSDCTRAENVSQINQHKEFIAATLQLLGERFYGKVNGE